jgi:hypothetical protein
VRVAVVLLALLVGIAIVALVAILPTLRRKSEVARLTELRFAALESAALAYANEQPGLAAEYERTAEALFRHIMEHLAEDTELTPH